MCRVMRHQRQPAAGMAPILDAAPHHEEACAAAVPGVSGVEAQRDRTLGMARTRGNPQRTRTSA